MTDFNCLLAGMIRLFTPLLLIIIWHKKNGARLFPAIVAFTICFPAFIIGGVIRSGFSQNEPIIFYIKQGILYGIVEEGTKYLSFTYLLTTYDRRKDAVSYGIGHSAFENLGAGLACLGLIGTDRAAPDIFWINFWFAIEGCAFVIALTVLVFYGVYTGKSKIILPIAVFLHAFSNTCSGIFYFNNSIMIIKTLLTAGECFVAYRCWQAMRSPFEDKS